MIFRAQSLRTLNAQRSSHVPQAHKVPCSASQRPLARSGSLAELGRLAVTESERVSADVTSSSGSKISSKGNQEVPIVEVDLSNSTFPAASTLAMTAALVMMAGPAYAAYDKAAGDQLFKNLAGGAYVLLVCVFFYRLFRKRAKSGTTQSLRSQVQESIQDEKKARDADLEEKPVTSATALWGAVQAGVIGFLLFQVCTLIDGYFDGQQMPDQYTARNITVTLRTIVRGLAYLMTFLFGANCVGLSGLAIQLFFFPEKPEAKAQQEE